MKNTEIIKKYLGDTLFMCQDYELSVAYYKLLMETFKVLLIFSIKNLIVVKNNLISIKRVNLKDFLPTL
jgi:hypothetical protein